MGFYSVCCIFVAVWLYVRWAAAESTKYSTAAINTIKELERTINSTVNPCDDFEAYVCSGAGESNSVKAEKDIARTIHGFITERGRKLTDTGAIEKYYKAHKVCYKSQKDATKKLTSTKIIEKSLSKFDEYLKSISFDQQTKLTGTMFSQVTAYLAAHHNLKTLVSIGIDKPPTNESIYATYGKVMVVREIQLAFELNNYEKDQTVLKEIFSEHYPLNGDENKEKNVNAMMEFEYQLLVPLAKLLQESNNVKGIDLTAKEASDKFPGVDWKVLIDTLSGLSGASNPSLCSRDDCVLHFFAPKVVAIVSDVITKTNPKVFKIYAQTRLMMALRKEDLFGQEKNPCIDLVERMFPLVLQHMYILKTYPTVADREKLKSEVTKLTDNILKSAQSMMEKVPWIKNDAQTLSGFNNKMNALQTIIAFPDSFANQSWIDEQYKDVVIEDSDDFFTLYLKAQQLLAKTALEKNETVNYVYTDGNAEMKTAGVKYNHHGFEIDWMSEESKKSFDVMAKCVVDEYSTFNITDSKGNVYYVNGELTNGENIADIGGMRAAYNAFKSDPAYQLPLPPTQIEGLTQDQLFFLSYAKYWCSPPITDDNIEEALGDAHTPNALRIYGTLRNFVPFREAFKCPINLNYAPEKHCEVYTSAELIPTNTSTTTTTQKPSTTIETSSGAATLFTGTSFVLLVVYGFIFSTNMLD